MATYAQRHEAEMALGLLEDAGIAGVVSGDDSFMAYPPSMARGVRLLVSPDDASRAREVLEGAEEIPAPRAPSPGPPLDEAGGRAFVFGFAAIAAGSILAILDVAGPPVGGGLGAVGWAGVALAAAGVIAVVRSVVD